MEISFFVPGIPATSGSKTGFYNKKAKRVIMAPAGKRQKPWMSSISAMALSNYDGDPTMDAVVLRLKFYMPRAKSHYGTGRNSKKLKPSAPEYHVKKPDTDKLARAAQDALSGIIWKDDSQVFDLSAVKCYTESIPGVEISVRTA